MRRARNVTCTGDKRDVHNIRVEKPEGVRQLAIHRRRFKYNIKIYIMKANVTIWFRSYWLSTRVELPGFVNMVMYLRIPKRQKNLTI
jgi:hypothetical protein